LTPLRMESKYVLLKGSRRKLINGFHFFKKVKNNQIFL